jgi:hypothetical protein
MRLGTQRLPSCIMTHIPKNSKFNATCFDRVAFGNLFFRSPLHIIVGSQLVIPAWAVHYDTSIDADKYYIPEPLEGPGPTSCQRPRTSIKPGITPNDTMKLLQQVLDCEAVLETVAADSGQVQSQSHLLVFGLSHAGGFNSVWFSVIFGCHHTIINTCMALCICLILLHHDTYVLVETCFD